MNFNVLLPILAGIIFATEGQARSQNCHSGSGYSWCVDREPQSQSGLVIYYLHGNGGSEKSWETPEHDQLYKIWQASNVEAPIVVTVSFGASWFLNQNLQNLLLSSVIPTVEKVDGINPVRRVLLGESMGGFNAAVLLKKSPRSFAKTAVICPAIYNVSPYAAADVIENYSFSIPATSRKFFFKWIGRQASSFKTEGEWLANDPLSITEGVRGLKVFLLGDAQDPLGFYEGASILKERLQQKGSSLKWWSIPAGNHCQHSNESLSDLAKFLSSP